MARKTTKCREYEVAFGKAVLKWRKFHTLLQRRNSRTTAQGFSKKSNYRTRRTTSAIYRITTELNIRLSELAKEEANQDGDF